MTNPDFRYFVLSLAPGHASWLSANPTPSGNDFLDHYVGDSAHPNGLLYRYEKWRTEHGYTRVRPWNGCEALGRPSHPNIPSPGRVLPWLPSNAGPVIDPRLGETRTTANLQSDFGVGNTGALGLAAFDQWQEVQSFPTPGASELADDATALFSIRFWGFMKWASVLRNRLLGIPVFPIPITHDSAGVPLSDIEFMDLANRWHGVWHRFTPHTAATCTAATSGLASSFGQVCSRPTTFSGEEFMLFHRDLLNIYDEWRRRASMPMVERWKPPELHFHPGAGLPNADVPPPDGLEISEDPAQQREEVKRVVRHFNTLESLGEYAEGELHGAGHTTAEGAEIADPFTNNYSPRFMAWHRWIDYLWEIRQPRFDSFRMVASDGSPAPGVLTVVRPPAGADQIQPNNALTGLTPQGQGSLWVRYVVRPETWGRSINLSLRAEVFLDSADTTPVVGLTTPPIVVNAVPQGVESAATEIPLPGTDGDNEGAFARLALPGGGVGFKNGRIRITAELTPVGNIPGSVALGDPNDQFRHRQHVDIYLVKENTPPDVSVLLNKSSFSVDEVTLNAGGNPQSLFVNSFFVVLQDPPAPPLAFDSSSIFTDRSRLIVSGVEVDPAYAPTVQVVDESNTPVNWFSVTLTDAFKEQPGLHKGCCSGTWLSWTSPRFQLFSRMPETPAMRAYESAAETGLATRPPIS